MVSTPSLLLVLRWRRQSIHWGNFYGFFKRLLTAIIRVKEVLPADDTIRDLVYNGG